MSALTSPSRLLLARLLSLVLALCVSRVAVAGEGHDPTPDAARLLGQGWTWLEAGHLRKAEDTFKELIATPEGALSAEAHYALSVVWWERGDARAAWSWLDQARQAALGSHGWNPGLDGSWDRRIEERLKYIQSRFTVRKLVPPDRGSSIPPLADPPPNDPVLRRFTDALGRLVLEGEQAAPGSSVWLLLPDGSYWIGERLEWHGGGEMDATRAPEWAMRAASGADQEEAQRRITTIADGGSEGRVLIRKLMIARKAPADMVRAELQRQKAEALAADYARRRTELEAARARQQALLAAGRRDEAARVSFELAPSGDAGSNHAILTWDEVDPTELGAIAAQLSEVWTAPGWHLRYAVQVPGKDTSHSVQLPELGLVIRFDGTDLLIRGTHKLKESLKDVWFVGGRPNRVDVWFDGTQVRVTANGREIGPIEVVRTAPAGRTRWKFTMNDENALFFDLRVEQFSGY